MGNVPWLCFFKLPASWWFQPIWKILSSNWTISLGKDENKKSFETTTQPIIHEDYQPNSKILRANGFRPSFPVPYFLKLLWTLGAPSRWQNCTFTININQMQVNLPFLWIIGYYWTPGGRVVQPFSFPESTNPETSKLTLGRLVATTGTWYSSALVNFQIKCWEKNGD